MEEKSHFTYGKLTKVKSDIGLLCFVGELNPDFVGDRIKFICGDSICGTAKAYKIRGSSLLAKEISGNPVIGAKAAPEKDGFDIFIEGVKPSNWEHSQCIKKILKPTEQVKAKNEVDEKWITKHEGSLDKFEIIKKGDILNCDLSTEGGSSEEYEVGFSCTGFFSCADGGGVDVLSLRSGNRICKKDSQESLIEKFKGVDIVREYTGDFVDHPPAKFGTYYNLPLVFDIKHNSAKETVKFNYNVDIRIPCPRIRLWH